ncbi:hypothetical protein LCGC14_0550050 [marine sediment metagenome]|uniref:Uncharacterized protein n=1 Tax=marine sediment metagenome TaxID=412755 RepID=A0A0F9UYF0_9ZZZZ
MINTKIENRKIAENKLNLNKFVYEYAKTHIFISKVMLSGLYATKKDALNPQSFQKGIRRKISNIFRVYSKLGIVLKYGQNTVKIIDREKLIAFKPEEIAKYSIHDFRKKPVKIHLIS